MTSPTSTVAGRSAHPRDDHQFATGTRAMVSTSHPLATAAALDMLRRGGTAADAYLAAAAVQVVVEPPMTTFGGALSMNFFDATSGRTTVVGGTFGRPAAEPGDWDEAGADGGRTVCAPGWLVGARAAWRSFGGLGWAELFGHALEHARAGFVIDPYLWGVVWEYRHKLGRFAAARRVWYPQGHLLGVGDRLTQPELAATIERLQADPELRWFHEGDFADRYVATAQADGGRLTLDEMAAHRDQAIVLAAEPVGRYRGHDIHAPGGTLIGHALQAAEHGELARLGRPVDNPEALYVQMRLVEELWHAGLAVRTAEPAAMVLGGPAAIADSRAIWRRAVHEPSRPFDPMHPGTNAVVVVDPAGNVAFGTHSCSCRPFGNGHVVDGVWLSRPMLAWGQPVALPAGIATSLLLARADHAVLAMGSPSVSCLSNVLQNTFNIVEFGLSPADSVRQPMFGAPSYPSRRARVEGHFPERHFEHLGRRGMGFTRVSPDEFEMGSCHMVRIDGRRGVIDGVADPRRRGQAAGM